MAIDWNKPVEDTEGRAYTVLTMNRPYAPAPVVAMREDGVVVLSTIDGESRTINSPVACPSFSPIRLRNVKPPMVKRMGVVGIRRNRHGELIADLIGPEKHCEYIATSAIEWEEESPF